MQELKNKMISESGLYRDIESGIPTNRNWNSLESKEKKSEGRLLTKDLVSGSSQGYKNETIHQNTRESTNNYNPKFHL